MAGSPYSITKRKESGRYYARFRLPDGSWTNMRSTGCKKKGEAVAWCEEYLLKVGRPTSNRRISLQEYATGFFDPGGRYETRYNEIHERPVSPSHVRNQKGKLDNYIVPTIGPRKLDTITPADIEHALRYIRDNYTSQRNDGKPLGHHTINSIRSAMVTLFEAAIRDGLIARNPAKHAFRLSGKAKRRGILSAEEIRKLIDRGSAPQWADYRYYLITRLAVFTAGRLSELRTLHVEDLLPGEVIFRHSWEHSLNREKDYPKNGEHRRAPIPPELEEELQEWIASWGLHPSDYLFPSIHVEGVPVSQKAVDMNFRKALERIGISEKERERRNLVFHGLRHAAATLLVAEGVNEWLVKRLTGHKSAEVFAAYVDHAEGADWQAVRSWQNNMLLQKIGGAS